MAACLRIKLVFQATLNGCGCHHLRMASIQPLSFLAAQQPGRVKPLLNANLVSVPQCRPEMTFSKKRRKFTPKHKEDGVSSDMSLVYENNMNRMNFWGQLVINALAVPIYTMSANIVISNWPLQTLSFTSGPVTALVYIFSYTALLLGVNNICRRSIHRIYTDADTSTFSAIVQDWKMTTYTVTFDLSAVQRKPPGQVFGVFFGNLQIRGKSFLITPSDFVQPRFYNLLMGYELQRSAEHDEVKDIDFRDAMRKAAKSLQKASKKE